MILTCPNCSVRYILDSQVLGPGGRLVRCSSCRHIWLQEAEDGDGSAGLPADEDGGNLSEPEMPGEDIPESVKPDHTFPDNDLSEEKDLLPSLTGVAASVLVFLLVCAFAVLTRNGIVRAWPPSAMAFGMAGFELETPGEGLIFDRVSATVSYDEDGEAMLEITGKIINLRDKAIPLPEIEAGVIGVSGVLGDTWKVKLEASEVGAEQSLRFAGEHRLSGGDAEQVRVGFATAE